MWEFYESKHGKAWTWERETTGRMFTAALLSNRAMIEREAGTTTGRSWGGSG
jgi:hypothetical protein